MTIDIKDIKLVRNRKTRFHKKFIRDMTRELHIYEHIHHNSKMYLYNRFYIFYTDKNAYIIFYKNKPIGTISIHRKPNNPIAGIWRFIIKEEYRGHGIGQVVLSMVDKILSTKERILLDTLNESRTKDFYIRNGYQIIPNNYGKKGFTYFVKILKED